MQSIFLSISSLVNSKLAHGATTIAFCAFLSTVINDTPVEITWNAPTEEEAQITLGNVTVNYKKVTVTGNATMNDTKLSALPGTGGIGTTIFTIGGCLIMIAAAGLFFASRRKTK